jgi:hypothetical protein
MPLMWMEPRCDVGAVLPVSAVYRRHGECHETGPGMFARRVSPARGNAVSAGWIVKDDKWVCPACAGKEIAQEEAD